jgi:hypothetical protein
LFSHFCNLYSVRNQSHSYQCEFILPRYV